MPSRLNQYTSLFIRYMGPQWRQVSALAVLLLSSIGLQLVNPQFLRYFIDLALSKGSQATLFQTALLFLTLVFVGQVVQTAATYVGENVGWTATNHLRADLALHCLRLDLSFHQAHKPGEMIERVDGDVAALANFFSQFAIHILGSALTSLGVLLLLFREDVRIGWVSSAYLIVTFGALIRFQNMAVPRARAARQASASLAGFWEERLSGREDICSNAAKSYVQRQHAELLSTLLQKGRAGSVMQFGMWGLGEVLFALGSAAALAVGAFLFLAGQMTIGTVYLVSYYTGLLSWNLSRIMEQMSDLQTATAGMERIDEVLLTPGRIKDGPGTSLPQAPAAVEFQDVSFGYAGDGGVLRGVSFRLEPGTILGVLGRTGSGKTTLARLLFRFYDPDRGAIRLGDADIRQARLKDLRRYVGMVTQDVQLFHASVRDNLTLFDRKVPDCRVLQVIEELGLDRWYRSLPQGLDTELMSGGATLSAGEAQLVAFARVFLREPVLVILDEASSRLDPTTEHLIECTVDKLLKNRTGLVIAHHLGTVRRAHQILILEDGHICEFGPREQLAATVTSRFYRLMHTGEESILA